MLGAMAVVVCRHELSREHRQQRQREITKVELKSSRAGAVSPVRARVAWRVPIHRDIPPCGAQMAEGPYSGGIHMAAKDGRHGTRQLRAFTWTHTNQSSRELREPREHIRSLTGPLPSSYQPFLFAMLAMFAAQFMAAKNGRHGTGVVLSQAGKWR